MIHSIQWVANGYPKSMKRADTRHLIRFSHSAGQSLRKVPAHLGVAWLYFAGVVVASLAVRGLS